MKEILKKYNKWKSGYDTGRLYDEIHEFFDAELSRGECLDIMEYLEKQPEPGGIVDPKHQ